MAPAGEGLLVLHIETHDHVKWHLKAAMERKDITRVIREMPKPSALFHTVRALCYCKRRHGSK